MSEYDVKNPSLVLCIAFTGSYPHEQHQAEVLLTKIDNILKDTFIHVSQYANEKYGFADVPQIEFVTAAGLIDEQLLDRLKKQYPNRKFHIFCDENRMQNADTQTEVSVLDNNSQSLTLSYKLMFSWICDQSDYMIIVNDGENALLQELIKHCKYENVPSIHIHTSLDRHILWTEKSYYDSYNVDKLKEYIDGLFCINNPFKNSYENKKILGRKLLLGDLYARYMKKNKVKLDNLSYVKDNIMGLEYIVNGLGKTAEESRKKLLGIFYEFDQLAIKYADKYRASIYLRAVIPLFITFLLATGFYLETLLSPWPITIPGTTLSLWSILAGLGFFAHALMNLYIYRLSENRIVQSWHRNFIENRFIAEGLRLAIHFIPFGIPVNFFIHRNQYTSENNENKQAVLRLKWMLKDIGLPATQHNDQISSECLNSLEELVNDQVIYHKNSANRFVNIFHKIKKYGKIGFYIGFLFILFRGGLQLYLSFFKLQQKFLGQDLQPMIKSFTNMLALLFPAWASYFSSKLTLCNFENLYNNDLKMLQELDVIKQMIYDERQKDILNYNDIYYLSKDVTSIILGEFTGWYLQINDKKLTRL